MNDILRAHSTMVRRLWILAEILVVAAGFVTAYYVRDKVPAFGRMGLYPFLDYLPLLIVASLVWSFVLYGSRLYHTQRLASIRDQWLRLSATVPVVGLVLGLLLYFTRASWVSRSLVALFLAVTYILLGLERTGTLWAMHRARSRGRNLRYAVIVGGAESTRALVRIFQDNSHWGIELRGRVSLGDEESEAGEAPEVSLPLLGALDDLPMVLEDNVVDEVIIALRPAQLHCLKEIIVAAELRGINVRLIADFVGLGIARTEIGQFNGQPVLTFTTLPKRTNELLFKRVFDIVVTVALLPGVLPLIATLLLLLRISGTRSPLFRQERVGRNGRRFTMYKLRTMLEASAPPAEALESANKLAGPVFKANPDPRVTPVGQVLRRWSLDELPQLLNVLKGEMSLVGPRPALPSEVERYKPWQRRRLSMRPGMTGLWQVSGRSDVGFEEWMRLDLEYIDRWTMATDIRILGRTIPVVLSGRGAY